MAKGPEPSCSSSPGSIVSMSSRDSSGGSSLSSGQSRYKVRKDKHHQSKHYSLPPSSSSESDSEFKSVSQAGSISSHGSRPSRNYERDPRLPNFTGREAWKDVLLPKVQGAAGDYVFDELSREEWANYKELIKCLKRHFHKVESTKKYDAIFWKCGQKVSETEETYVAELKWVYGKAYPQWDSASRDEDLLCRFLNGLIDQ